LITGSLTISGSSTFTNIGPAVFSGSLTSTAGFTGSFSGTATSASYAANAELLDGLDSSVFTLTSSFAAQTASFTAFTSSILSYTASQNILNGTYALTSSFNEFSASILAQTASLNAFSASILAQTASLNSFSASILTFTSSQNILNGTYATTGSNTFTGIQTVNSNLIVTGSITAQTLVVQTITSSVDFVTGSTRFGSILGNTHVFSGSVTMNPGGLFVSSSGNVGIGTTNPATYSGYTTLAINNATNGAVLDFLSNGTRVASINNGGASFDIETKTATPMVFGTNNTERMRLDISGSLGLGVIPSAWYTGYTALQVGFSGAIWSNKTSADTNTTMIGNNAYLNSGATNWIYQNNGFATRYTQVSGGHEFYTAASGTAGNAITWATLLTIASTGVAAFSNSLTTSDLSATFLSPSLGVTQSVFLELGKNISNTYNSGEMSFKYVGDGSTSNMVSLGFYGSGNKLNVLGSGNVGIGTSSPSQKLEVSGTDNNNLIMSTTTTGAGGTIRIQANEAASYLVSNNARPLYIQTNSSTALTIASSGAATFATSISVGTTITAGAGQFVVHSNGAASIGNPTQIGTLYIAGDTTIATNANIGSNGGYMTLQKVGGNVIMGAGASTNGQSFINPASDGAYQIIGHPSGTGTGYSYTIYQYAGGSIGGVGQSGTTAVVYNTTSDYRLKENATPIANATSKIMQLKPVSYKWKNTEDEYGEGFLAHELQEIIPLAVTGEKDALYEDGSFKLQQVDHSKLVPMLVKAIQEQQTLITALQEKLERNNIN